MGPVIHKFITLPRHLLRGTFLVYFVRVRARGWGMERGEVFENCISFMNP